MGISETSCKIIKKQVDEELFRAKVGNWSRGRLIDDIYDTITETEIWIEDCGQSGLDPGKHLFIVYHDQYCDGNYHNDFIKITEFWY